MLTPSDNHQNTASVTRRAFLALAAAGAGLAFIPMEASASTQQKPAEIVDSLMRPVSLGDAAERCIIPLGPNTQTLLEMLCPDSLASLVVAVSEEAAECANNSMLKLDSLSQTKGERGDLHNTARKLRATKTDDIKPSLILDVGTPKDNIESELDALERETGIPCAFIDISFGKLPDAFRKVSVLLGCASRGEELASATERALELSMASSEYSTPAKVFYAPRENGIKVGSGVSVQAAAIEHVGAQPITSAYDYSNKTVSFATLLEDDPDMIVFDDTGITSLLKDKGDETSFQWSKIPAIEWNRFIVSPSLMKSWFGSIVFVQSAGVLWLSKMLHPESSSYDLAAEIQDLYSLFYGLEKSREEIESLIG